MFVAACRDSGNLLLWAWLQYLLLVGAPASIISPVTPSGVAPVPTIFAGSCGRDAPPAVSVVVPGGSTSICICCSVTCARGSSICCLAVEVRAVEV